MKCPQCLTNNTSSILTLLNPQYNIDGSIATNTLSSNSPQIIIYVCSLGHIGTTTE